MNKPEPYCPTCLTNLGEITFRSVLCEDKYHERENEYYFEIDRKEHNQ